MNGEDLYPESSRSLDDLWQMRLLLLLMDMSDDLGKVKAVKTLGVNYRTLDRAVESGRLTERMSDALERRLQSGAARWRPGSGSATMPWRVALRSWTGRSEVVWKRLWQRLRERLRLCGRSRPGDAARGEAAGAAGSGKERD